MAAEQDGDDRRDTGRAQTAAVAAVGAARSRAVRRAAPGEARARGRRRRPAARRLPPPPVRERRLPSAVGDESAVVLATLCFFFLRFGFRL